VETANNLTKEEQERINAIKQYFEGRRPTKIYTDFGRSKHWFYKWLKRYILAIKNPNKIKTWFKDNSKAPKNVHRKISSKTETLIVSVRKSLVEGNTDETKYRCIGLLKYNYGCMNLDVLQKKFQVYQRLSVLSREIN
jgi:hypothetical protein